MKHALLLAAAASALSLASCDKKEAVPEATAAGTAATSDTAVPAAAAMATDVASQEAAAGPIDPVPVATSAPAAAAGAPSASPGASESTRAVVNGVALTDLYQVQAGKIAEAKAQSAAVKDFAKSMVSDHTEASSQMKQLFVVTKVPVPTELGPRGQRMIAALEAAAPADFDKVYLDQQQAAQAAELTVLRVYADGGESSDIRPAAAKRIPKVQASLEKVQELQAAQTPTQ